MKRTFHSCDAHFTVSNLEKETIEDWQVFRKQQKAIEENSLVEWAIEEE